MNKKTKIYLGKYHLAYVRSDLLLAFRQKNRIINFMPWLRKTINDTFQIDLQGPDDIAALEAAVNSQYFDSIGDWLQNLMRNDIKFQ